MTIRLEVYLVEAGRRRFYSVDACQIVFVFRPDPLNKHDPGRHCPDRAMRVAVQVKCTTQTLGLSGSAECDDANRASLPRSTG